MQGALDWAKAAGALRRIELYVFASNAPAIRLYERFGFTIEGRRKEAVRMGDILIDDLLMACLVPRPDDAPQPAPPDVSAR
jgi:putative acetyltransferase